MDEKNHLTEKGIAVLLLLFISIIAALNLFMPNRAFSESENRVLAQPPKFSIQALFAGSFTSNFESYVSDQFVFRDLWIGAKTDLDRALRKKESNSVYLGRDGYLIQQFAEPAAGALQARIEAIQAFHEAAPELHKYAMIVPTAASVYQDKLPKYAKVGAEQTYMHQLKQMLPHEITFVDLFPVLYAQREQLMYYKTDHHWTTKGAYAAYLELCKQMKLNPQAEDSFHIRRITDQFYGSLYSKSGYKHLSPDSIELYLPKDELNYTVTYVDEARTTNSLYAMDQLQKKDKYAVFLNGNYGMIQIKTEAAHSSDNKLLIVKDSYANSFIPFLLKHFSEIDVVDLRYYEGELTELVNKRGIKQMLLLYNINTFFEDPSILHIAG